MKSVKKIACMVLVFVAFFIVSYVSTFAENQYTEDLCTDGSKASASSAYDDRVAGRAFDNSSETYLNYAWTSTNTVRPHWLMYDFGTGNEKKIEKVTLSAPYCTDGANLAMPKDWILQGSNDNSSWTNIYSSPESTTGYEPREKREFTFSNSNSYRYYRIYITSIYRADYNYTFIGEMEMMERIASSISSPTNLTATAGNASVNLAWNPVADVTGYNVKRATTTGGPYTTIAENVTDTTYTDDSVTNETAYYYVVTAVSSSGESSNSNEASATPTEPVTPPNGGNGAILEITMINGFEKEYDLTASELEDFLDWYDSVANGTGKGYYTFTLENNIKPFLSRTEYIAFDKILSFEVKEYEE